jgi:hypothetical protein
MDITGHILLNLTVKHPSVVFVYEATGIFAVERSYSRKDTGGVEWQQIEFVNKIGRSG